ncbi:quinone oxidoreductase family protein [Alicyclobacillus ferrooxydans]|uniref:Quinone oxidoreductase n=1 Tax=Alicyclobacillus ferrooxydans TaxID=471514 RepID=A0A0N8PPR9_9BACL|nr:quinone oxidoreductase [Alicyclobacillus ferrooxydans]KPV45093.1 quinone oxidoreductase [Alicyclobacillus ferrooxydans]
MKAIVVSEFGAPEVLQYQDVSIPAAGAREVLIRVKSTSVNFADIKARYGNYHNGAKPPFIPGLDVAGTVEAIGSDVTGFTVGQRVIAFPNSGSYAEYAVASEQLTFALPDSLNFSEAAACPTVAFTSYKLLTEVGRLAPSETVLVHAAAGGIGTTVIQMAKALGAGRIIGTVSSPEKITAAREAGADVVICYSDTFDESVRELTNGQGVDLVLDSIGSWVSEKSMNCLADYGRLVNFSNPSGEGGKILTTDLHSSCRSVLGYSLGTTLRKRPQALQDTAQDVLRLLAQGTVKMNIGERFALHDAAKAHRWMESRQSTGKILLDVLQ